MRARGFTLVEVLVAFTIVAIVAGVTAQAISSGLFQVRRASAITNEILLGRSIIDAVGVETPLAEGVSEGALGDGARWRVEITRVADAGDGLYRVDLILFEGPRQTLELSTLKVGG